MQAVVPTFPLGQPPTCRTCGGPGDLVPAARRSNPIGNAGRPYYICLRGKHEQDTWITFDDDIGILDDNPQCECGYTSRVSNRRDGDGQFYSCPVGRCRFKRNGMSLTPQETQVQVGANWMGMGSGSWSADRDKSQGPIEPVLDYDMMDVD